MAPGIGVFAFFVLRLAPGRPLAITLALGVLMMPTVLQRSALAVETLLRPRVTLQNPPVFTGMRLLPKDAAALSPFLAALDDYIAKHPKTAMLIDGGAAAIYLPSSRTSATPRISGCTIGFSPSRSRTRSRPAGVSSSGIAGPSSSYYLDDDPTPSEQSTPYELEKQNRSIRVNRDRRANMEEILRDDHYVELAFARVAEGHASLILLGPRD